MSRFTGKYYYSIDPKGRVMVPSAFRDILREHYDTKLIVTVAPVDRCLHLYPVEEWENLLEKVSGLPKSHRSMKLFLRTVVGSAVETEIDKQGRVLVPSSLRTDGDL
ncbi:MAG TPA: division/cell wall cluster transcriptional repressor MraZ, partial [Nitrospirae bacterium]|nr:division/cell wall cluster transcriptional repressor MraZ [Nitrospirota bacterium]